jgi:hypothetical protein
MLANNLRAHRAAIWKLLTAVSLIGCQCTFPALAQDTADMSGQSESGQSEAVHVQPEKSGESEAAPDQLQRLSFAEQLYFGQASNDPAAESRLARLERALYGRARSGSFEKRFSRIDDALGVEVRMRQARVTSSGASPERPLKVTDRIGDHPRIKESAPSIDEKATKVASAKSGLDIAALTPTLANDAQEPEVASPFDPTSVSKPLEPTAVSKPLDSKLTSKPTDPKLTSKPTDPKLTSKPTDPKLASKPADPKLASKTADPKLTSKTADPKLTSKTADSKLTNKTADPKLTSKPADPKLTNKAEAPKLAKPLEPKFDNKSADSKLASKPLKPNGNSSSVASSPPSPAQVLLKQGMAAHKAGNHQVAEDKFKRVLAMEPRNADAFFNLGAIAETRGDLLGALTNYRAALGINPLDRQLQDAVRSIEDQVANQNGTASSIAFNSHSASSPAYNRPPVYDVTQQTAPVYNVSQYPPPAPTNPNAFSLGTAAYGANLQNQTPVYGVSQQPPPIYNVSQQPPPIYNVSQFPPPVVPVSSVPHCPVCHVTHNQPPTHGLINAFLSAGGGAALGPLHCPICRLSHMGW